MTSYSFAVVASCLAASMLGQAEPSVRVSRTSVAPSAIRDTVSGKWRGRGADESSGNVDLTLTLVQRGDSVEGRGYLVYPQLAREAAVKLKGTMRAGQLALREERSELLVEGILRDGKLVVSIAPGRLAPYGVPLLMLVRSD